jgi:hypothetical protein
MRLFFCALASLVFGISAFAAGYPPVNQLPSRPDLPDPLVMFDGTPVTTRKQWFEKRRPEIQALFEHYVYGKAPAAPSNVIGHVDRHDPQYFAVGQAASLLSRGEARKEGATVSRRQTGSLPDGKATMDQVTITFGPRGTPPIHVLLVVPHTRAGAAPVFVALNFCGNHAILNDASIALPQPWMPEHCKGCVRNQATDAGRGSQAEAWAVENAVDRGYALATCYSGDIDPDRNDDTDGVQPHFRRVNQTRPGENDWGTIRAWAWGTSRIIDYLTTRPDIDPHRICVTGHSRLGKTALVAAAFDERIALVVPHQSGTGGCALSRDNDQETVERITRVFPWWFDRVFPEFAHREDRLPVDQHLLMCLVAPRPIFDTEGDQDQWSNPNSALRALKAADRVYKFLGQRGMIGSGMIRGEEPIDARNIGDLAQYRRNTRHVLNKDYWNKMFDFADAYFARSAGRP